MDVSHATGFQKPLMELDNALEIVTLFADSIDPATGEGQSSEAKPRPKKAGAPWLLEEDQQLTKAFKKARP